jgi:hypothetical protein
MPNLLRCSKPSRWRQPPRETRIPQQKNTQVPTRYKFTSKCTWDHSISLWLGNQVREISERGCAQLKRMLESQNVQAQALQTGQTHIYKQPQRIEPLGTKCCCNCADQTRRANWPDAPQRPVTTDSRCWPRDRTRCLNWPNALHAASGPSTERVQRGFFATGRVRSRLTGRAQCSINPVRLVASPCVWPDAPVPRSTERGGRTDHTRAARCSATDRTR